ncbi:MAG: hypothetical protein ING33_07805 [Rhodocyclaceae bacterium]|nr:hypothetical protein [Rhodocyclaceae bacterium]
MLVERTVFLSCSPQKCFAEVQTPRLMLHIARPLVRFAPIEPKVLPERWEQKEYLVSVRIFGLLPMGRQWVNISGRDRSNEFGRFYVELRDNGCGTLISTWDHLITLQASGQGCSYSDRVEVRAGLLTPLVWAFAWFFYRHRQRRWEHLVANGFAYGQP